MRDLRVDEIKAVSGAGLIGKIVGGIIINKAIKAALKDKNTPNQNPQHKIKLPNLMK
jgi:hypothetical protein